MGKVNPKIDLVFKKLFGSEENKDILLSLINAILPTTQQVAKIALKNPYNVSDYTEGKLSILDIKAEGEDGRLFDIEMQIKGSRFYGKRVLFYWAKIVGSQLDQILDEGDNPQEEDTATLGYSDLKKCIVISLMDFNFFDDRRYHRFHTLKDGITNEQHKDLDYLDLYFIELKKYKGKLADVKTVLERWITFLNYAHKYENKNLPQELAEIKEIRKASRQLEAMYLDEQEKNHYEAQQKFWLDQNSLMQEAISKAVEQTKIDRNIEIARNAIKEGLDNQIVKKLTGLTINQIEQLRIEK